MLLITSIFFFQSKSNHIVYCASENPSHLVDERLELMSLIFRLADMHVHTQNVTDYQLSLADNFYQFREHPAVNFARSSFDPSYCIISTFNLFQIADGVFQLNSDLIDSHSKALEGTSIDIVFFLETFIDFLNCFYTETEFNLFFKNNYEYFLCHSERFMTQIAVQMNCEWFIEYGIYQHNMNIVLAPGISSDIYVGLASYYTDPHTYETVAYAILTTSDNYCLALHLFALVHEFVHPFADQIAYDLFWENTDFREWCIRTFANDSVITRDFRSPIEVAREYVTNAFTILYLTEHTSMSLERLLYWEYAHGYTYIQEVFSLITEHENFNFQTKTIADLSLPAYTLSDINSYIHNGNEITWRFLEFEQQLDFASILIPNCIEGAAFGSTTNDVFYVAVGSNKQLLIDLGCGVLEGFTEGIRMVHRIHID